MNQDQIEAAIAFQKHELETPGWELDWLQFIAKVEIGLGHGLDGDQNDDGYSLDSCHDFYADGLSSDDAIAEFKHLIQQANRISFL